MGFWSTGTKEVLIGIISGAFTIALVSLAVSRADGLSKLISGSADGFTKILKAAMGSGQGGY